MGKGRGMQATLTIAEAADYLGMKVSQFRRAVARKELPEPLIKCRPQRWARVQIDWTLEGRAVSAPSLAESSDPVMERLNAIRHEIPV